MTYNKIPIEDIKYQLSLILPEMGFDDELISELATSCYRQIGHEAELIPKIMKLSVEDHQAVIEDTNFYNISSAYVCMTNTESYTLTPEKSIFNEAVPSTTVDPPISMWTNGVNINVEVLAAKPNEYVPMYQDDNLTITDIDCITISSCLPAFKIRRIKVAGADKFMFYTNVKSGVVLLHSVAHDDMMIDDEDVKQAIIKYVVATLFYKDAIASMDYKKIQIASQLEREAKTYMGKVKGKLNLPGEETLEKMRMLQEGFIKPHLYDVQFKFAPTKTRLL